MADGLYYCEHYENTCPKKKQCRRYINTEDPCVVPLFKMMCTENNNYVLYMHSEISVDRGDSVGRDNFIDRGGSVDRDASVCNETTNNNSNEQKEDIGNV